MPEYEVHWLATNGNTACGILSKGIVFAFNEDSVTCRYCRVAVDTLYIPQRAM